jgi:hypothetical protein
MLLNPLLIILIVSSFAGLLFLVAVLGAAAKFKVVRVLRMVLPTMLCLSIATLSGVLLVANHGYRSFTKETLAATVVVKPQGGQRFTAHVLLPDSTETEYEISGDMFYIDAHILKWHPLLNLIGVHTSYELDRIGGRYNVLDDEKKKPRTIYSLAKKKVVNMYSLRMRFLVLKPLLDAAYGSATYVEVEKNTTLHIMVSTSGLLVRH